MQSIIQTILPTKIYKVLGLSFISLLLSACGGATITITPDFVSKYNGNWQSSCKYDSSRNVSYIETLYISDTDYTLYTDEYDNSNCIGNSNYETEIQGFLYFGNTRSSISNFCSNTVEVDFTASVIYENGRQIPSTQISAFLNLQSNTSFDLICTDDDELYRGDYNPNNGRFNNTRPLSLDITIPFFFF